MKLKSAMALYAERFGERVTYEWLAEQTGLSRATIESLASRTDYDTRLSTVGKLCAALRCEILDLIELTPSEGGTSAGVPSAD